jgi:hypothetical protein
MPAVSPAAEDRGALHNKALDDDRRATRRDLNRDQADQQLEPSHGDPPRSRTTPNTGNGRVQR